MNMRSSVIENSHPSKPSRNRSWVILIVLILGLPLLFYYGYCWGLWGRSSLLLQYLFQCSCPPASEEARYPQEVNVIISACRQSNVELSPSGRVLYVREKKSGITTATYLLDLQTMERTDVFNQPFSKFLTDDLWFAQSGLENYIIDRTSGMQYPIQTFLHLQPQAYSYGKVDPNLLFNALLPVERVFLIDAPYQPVIALSSDFRTHPEHSFTFNGSDLPGGNTGQVEQFLQQNNILYYHTPASFPDEVISPDGRFVARADGIYLVNSNQKVVDAYPFRLRGWTNDSRGVIYSSDGRCLIQRGLPFSDDVGCATWVPQPVIKLKVSEEYLFPNETP